MGGLEKGLILTFRRLLDPPFRPLLLRAGMLLYVVLCCVVLCIGAGYVYAVRGWKPQFRLQILRSKIKGMGLWRKHQIMFECVCVCLLMLSTVQYCSAGSPSLQLVRYSARDLVRAGDVDCLPWRWSDCTTAMTQNAFNV